VEEFIAKGWIEPSSSSWSSSVLFVPKPNGKLRFCVDFRHLNARTQLNRSPIPNQGELLDNLQGSNVFSALDLASGFYQIAMAEDCFSNPIWFIPMVCYANGPQQRPSNISAGHEHHPQKTYPRWILFGVS
jgi:hypothetical protein